MAVVVGARQVAGDRDDSTAEHGCRLGDAGTRWGPENDFHFWPRPRVRFAGLYLATVCGDTLAPKSRAGERGA
ncbi:MAG: hypothetical protein JXP73_20945, partial [Deltaproteobacteria bacterium]|nr:hypothetical protein [Deltaproteobacteria bacterium]